MRLIDTDIIYKQDAVEALKNAEPLVRDFGYYKVIETIRQLPSAEPDPEWRKKHYKMAYNQGFIDACKYYENLLERKKSELIVDDFNTEIWGANSNCKLCGCSWQINNNGVDNFCPNCGADMRGGAQE